MFLAVRAATFLFSFLQPYPPSSAGWRKIEDDEAFFSLPDDENDVGERRAFN
jgi:hypothetical protein